jgi:hypothetical protein
MVLRRSPASGEWSGSKPKNPRRPESRSNVDCGSKDPSGSLLVVDIQGTCGVISFSPETGHSGESEVWCVEKL